MVIQWLCSCFKLNRVHRRLLHSLLFQATHSNNNFFCIIFQTFSLQIIIFQTIIIQYYTRYCQKLCKFLKSSRALREAVNYYFADFVRNPLFAENFVLKGGEGVPLISVTYFWTKIRCFLSKKHNF